MSSQSSAGKRRSKARHRVCKECEQPLPDDCEGDVCNVCSIQHAPRRKRSRSNTSVPCHQEQPNTEAADDNNEPSPQAEASTFLTEARSFFSWMKNHMQSTSAAPQKRKKSSKRRESSSSSSSSSSASSADSEDTASSDSEDIVAEDYYLFKKEHADKLIKAVKEIIEVRKDKTSSQDKESLYYFPRKKSRVLSGHQVLKQIMEKEWKRPDKRVELGSRFKSVYRLDPAESELWAKPSQVDTAVVKLSKATLFPAEDSSILKDAMDRMMSC
ncbi:ADP-ribosylation factor-like protein 6-interacting protein 4 [Dendropsophus ebraccatus]|uniref:ADP-ribosylation factor-like protein 6-interacting protein 4 n=1 Tax=Dendropsophus ebraccatus TaxID=150705 RepID=UPI00383135A8